MLLKKRVSLVLDGILLGAVLYLFLFGRFFPYSPLTLGFKHKEFARSVVYFHKGADISRFSDVDKLIPGVEAFHQLKYKHKVAIFLCSSLSEKKRFTSSEARMTTFPPFGRIFVSLQAQQDALNNKIHIDVYLKHELSHALLEQNMSFWRFSRFPRWLLEGIAMYSADQMGVDGYYTKAQVEKYIQAGYFVYPGDWGRKFTKIPAIQNLPLADKYYFTYSQYGYIVQDLIEKYGREKFLVFLDKELRSGTVENNFQDTFGQGLGDYMEGFRENSAGRNDNEIAGTIHRTKL